MSISSIQITHFRNLSDINLTFSPNLNIFYGMNASGKTSFLETLHYLSTGKSFRTSQLGTIIQHNTESLSVHISLNDNETAIPIGMSRSINGSKQIRLNQESIHSIAPVTQLIPIQFIGTNCQSLLLDGPKSRRHFIDWGLFHSNQHFYNTWKSFQKLLTQRNAALKARAHRDEMRVWNKTFSETSEKLDIMRRDYIASFEAPFNDTISSLLNNHAFELRYFSGWDNSQSLSDHLNNSFFREQQAGFSLFGPQRAELQILSDGRPVQDVLSQGQQKLLTYALRLAQGHHLQNNTAKSPIYLIDDLPSELDHEKRALVLSLLEQINAQVFVTAIDPEQITATKDTGFAKLFHVKHGTILPV